MKKINPFKKFYYDSIREIEIKSGEPMTKAARKRFLIAMIICALIIGYLAFVVLIQPIGMHILGLKPAKSPITLHLMKNHTLSSVELLEDNEKNRNKVEHEYYKPDDSMYYILCIDEEQCKEVTVYGGEYFHGSGQIELKHLDGNQYYFEFIKGRFTVEYRINVEKSNGEIESYIWAYKPW